MAQPGSLRPLRTVRATFTAYTAQALIRLSRRRETRLLLFVTFTSNVVICLHSLAKSSLHLRRWKKYESNSGKNGLALLTILQRIIDFRCSHVTTFISSLFILTILVKPNSPSPDDGEQQVFLTEILYGLYCLDSFAQTSYPACTCP